MSVLKSRTFQCKQQLLECLISIIFHIQEEFANYYHKYVQLLMDIIKSNEPKNIQIKRVSIDAIYSIAAHCSKQIAFQKDEILHILDICRTDKN